MTYAVCYNEYIRFFASISMRFFRFWQLAGMCLIAPAAQLPAFAQQADKNAPPKLEKLEEGEPPAITVRPPASGKATVTEKRGPGGKRTEIKITSGNSTYYVKPDDPAGAVQPGDAQGLGNRPAQWQVMTFGPTEPPKAKEGGAAVPVPPPPALPAPQKK